MHVTVFGASGAIGSAIAAELLAQGHEVSGVSRRGTSTVSGVRPVTGDASDVDHVAELVSGAAAVITAIGPRLDGSESPDMLSATTRTLIAGLRKAGVTRLLAVGGAGSLLEADGNLHVDNPHFPDAVKPIAYAHAAALDIYRTTTDMDWTYVSPAASIEPGDRTGTFRVGGDVLLTDENGVSRIGIPDFAAGLVAELESPAAIRRRITIAY
jgi:putative NADH-flavin reductase